MATYTVHEPPQAESDRVDRAVDLEFVKDGFSWLTAICPPVGFVANGVWLMAIAYLAAAGFLGYLLNAAKIDQGLISLIFLMINVYLGFEISTLRRWMLDQKGWEQIAVVNGRSIAECERRFFETWLPEQPVIATEATHRVSEPPVRGSRFWSFGAGA